MKKLSKIIVVTILIVILFTAIPVSVNVYATENNVASDFKKIEDEIVRLFNNAREKSEMSKLEQDEILTELARIKAEEMAVTKADKLDFSKGIKKYLKDNSAESKAQNIYFTSGKKTAAEVVGVWKKHINFNRDTLAKEKTTYIGVGAAKGSDGKMYYVCFVIKPFGEAAKTALEDEVIRLVNAERKKQGLPLLIKNDDLTKTSRMKSQDMADNKYCDHISPTYGKPEDMVKTYTKNITYCGENIAAGQQTSNEVFTSWKNSSAHKAIMLKKSANIVGIGVSLDSKGNLIWSMLLGKK